MLGEGEELVLVVDADVVRAAALDLGPVAVDRDARAGLGRLDTGHARELEEEARVAALRAPPVLGIAERGEAGVLRVTGPHDKATAVGRRGT